MSSLSEGPVRQSSKGFSSESLRGSAHRFTTVYLSPSPFYPYYPFAPPPLRDLKNKCFRVWFRGSVKGFAFSFIEGVGALPPRELCIILVRSRARDRGPSSASVVGRPSPRPRATLPSLLGVANGRVPRGPGSARARRSSRDRVGAVRG